MTEIIQFDHPIKFVVFEKLKLLGFELWVISPNGLSIYPQKSPSHLPSSTLHYLKMAARLRSIISGKPILTALLLQLYLLPVGKRHTGTVLPNVWHFRRNPKDQHIFVVLGDPDLFPWYAINQIINTSAIESGQLPIHASAVEVNGNLLVFSGPSGAGKSTIAELCTRYGARILDDDQVLIRQNPDGTFSADAWGYGLQKSAAPIRAVFELIQSNKNVLVGMPESQTARFLFEQVISVCGIDHPNRADLFSITARLARAVPGCRLHFKKSPDFWALIEKELDLD